MQTRNYNRYHKIDSKKFEEDARQKWYMLLYVQILVFVVWIIAICVLAICFEEDTWGPLLIFPLFYSLWVASTAPVAKYEHFDGTQKRGLERFGALFSFLGLVVLITTFMTMAGVGISRAIGPARLQRVVDPDKKLVVVGRDGSPLTMDYVEMADEEFMDVVVVEVQDGDRIWIKDDDGRERLVLLKYIDAPDMGQDWARQAKDYLSSMILNKKVRVYHRRDETEPGRIWGNVVCDGEYVNLSLVAAGNAWYADDVYGINPRFEDAQKDAQKNKRGLWRSSSVVYPGVWRRDHRERKGRKL